MRNRKSTTTTTKIWRIEANEIAMFIF